MKKTILITLLLALAVPAFADDPAPAIEILPDKKVIYVQRMGIPTTSSVLDLLQMIPDLLNRDGDDVFSTFDIQYDGQNVSDGRDVILTETRLSELEKVEITSSPTVAQQKNGQGGVINLIPNSLNEGTGGEAFAFGTTEWDAMGGASLNHKKGKLKIRSSLNIEGFFPTDITPSTTISSAKVVDMVDTMYQRYAQETAKFKIDYAIDDRNEINFFVIESCSRTSRTNETGVTTITDKSAEMGPGWSYTESGHKTDNNISTNLYITSMAEYKHVFENKSKIVSHLGYDFNKERLSLPEKEYSETVMKPHSFSADCAYTLPITIKEGRKLTIESGANFKYNNDYTVNVQEGGNIYASPYVNFKYETGKWTVHAGARYQYYIRQFWLVGKPEYVKPDNDITANINAVWNLAHGQSLRFLIMRNLVRPTDVQLYPIQHFDATQRMMMKGNPDLQKEYLHTIEMNYVYDWHRDGHNLSFNAEIGYDRCDNIIKKRIYGQSGGSGGGFGLQMIYYSFVNSGTDNIVRTNVGLFYNKGLFSMSFSGNVFCNFRDDNGVKDNYTAFNLSLTPIFNFKRQWVLSAKLLYNGPVNTSTSMLGDCFFMQLRLNKTIRRWTISAVLSDVFDYVSSDKTYNSKETYISVYDFYRRFVGLGFTYKFGK